MADLDFDLTVGRDAGGGCRLTLRGELDLGTVPELERALAEARASRRASIPRSRRRRSRVTS